MIQIRPGGPRPDPALGALGMMRVLTEQSFGSGELLFAADGGLTPP
jgi:hypothetical protein